MLVKSALDSYVCIFAYGQTKTFMMEGGREEAIGIIPRAVEQIFMFSSDRERVAVHHGGVVPRDLQ